MTDKLARNLALSALEKTAVSAEGVTKDYVDTHLNNKLDKLESISANPRLYGISEEGAQTTYFATQTSNANTVVMRDASGNFQTEDGVAPKQVINKKQLDVVFDSCAKLSEENAFTAKNIFTQELEFRGVVEHYSNININDGVLRVLNSDDDYVTTYNHKEIKIEKGDTSNFLNYPLKNGTLALIEDIDEKVGFKHSTLINNDSSTNKEDLWVTKEEAIIGLKHTDTLNETSVSVSKAFFEIAVKEKGNTAKTSQITLDLNNVTITGIEGDTSTTLIVNASGATLNGEKIATEKSIGSLVDTEMSDSSENPVQNKVVAAAIKGCVKCTNNVQSGQLKVYCASANNSSDVCYASSTALGNAIVRYNANGRFTVNGDPSGDNEVVNKKYVDGIVPKYGASLPNPTAAAYKVGCSFLNTKTGGLYVLTASGSNNNRSWQLQTTLDKPAWKTFAPEDTSTVLFTKITINTSDVINFPGLNGKSVTIQGYSKNGFSSGTVVCDEIDGDIKFNPCFIGALTTSRASGVMIRGTSSITIVSVDNPEVTFSYEYLW